MQAPGQNRTVKSCTECYRRKQKCSREWPCNHCKSRKIPHLCRFGADQPEEQRPVPVTTRDECLAKRQAISGSEATLEPSPPADNLEKDGFKSLGYLPGIEQLDLPYSIFGDPECNSNSLLSEVNSLISVVPPRPYTDILVQSYLQNGNYQYFMIHPPSFTHQYVRWWADRGTGHPVSPVFTCMILRVCACAAQDISPANQQKLEAELGDPVTTLNARLHDASRRISGLIRPGKGGIVQVQQLLLTASWLKGESMFVDAWHTLCSAIHEAQELGLHKDRPDPDLTEFGREIRRRVWTVLFCWDWEMSILLSRPLIIHPRYSQFPLPSDRLEEDPVTAAPTPMTNMILQCQLIQKIIRNHQDITETVLPPEQVLQLQQDVQTWFNDLPAPFHPHDPDTEFDLTHSYVVVHRLILRLIGYMVMLCPFKPYLTRLARAPKSRETQHTVANAGLDACLRLMTTLREMHGYTVYMCTRNHYIFFCTFDSAAVLCSALFHDHNRTISQRIEAIEAIRDSIAFLEERKDSSIAGLKSFYRILASLADNLPLDPYERAHLSPQLSSTESTEAGSTGPPLPPTPTMPSDLPSTESVPDPALDLDPAFLPDVLAAEMTPFPVQDFRALPDVDFSELSHIWNWENLNLDFIS